MQKDNDSIGFDAQRGYRRKRAGRGITSFSSMKSFSRATGISLALLKQMKSDGAEGFHASGRINLFPWLHGLSQWLAGRRATDEAELSAENLLNYGQLREKFQGKSEKLKFLELSGQFVSKREVLVVLDSFITIHAEGFARMTQELPALLAGKNAAMVREELAKYLGEIKLAECEAVDQLRDKVQPTKEKEQVPA